VQSCTLHGRKTWPVRKENKVVLQRAEMRMVRWMRDIKVKDRVPSMVDRETRIRLDNLGTKVKQVATVWAYVAKRRQWWVKEKGMYGV